MDTRIRKRNWLICATDITELIPNIIPRTPFLQTLDIEVKEICIVMIGGVIIYNGFNPQHSQRTTAARLCLIYIIGHDEVRRNVGDVQEEPVIQDPNVLVRCRF